MSEAANEGAATSANHLIRDWAGENGYDIAHMGKIPAKVMKAFQKANSDSGA